MYCGTLTHAKILFKNLKFKCYNKKEYNLKFLYFQIHIAIKIIEIEIDNKKNVIKMMKNNNTLIDYNIIILINIFLNESKESLRKEMINDWVNINQTFNLCISKAEIYVNYLIIFLEHLKILFRKLKKVYGSHLNDMNNYDFETTETMEFSISNNRIKLLDLNAMSANEIKENYSETEMKDMILKEIKNRETLVRIFFNIMKKTWHNNDVNLIHKFVSLLQLKFKKTKGMNEIISMTENGFHGASIERKYCNKLRSLKKNVNNYELKKRNIYFDSRNSIYKICNICLLTKYRTHFPRRCRYRNCTCHEIIICKKCEKRSGEKCPYCRNT